MSAEVANVVTPVSETVAAEPKVESNVEPKHEAENSTKKTKTKTKVTKSAKSAKSLAGRTVQKLQNTVLPVRHRKQLNKVHPLRRPVIRRLGYRAGVLRTSKSVYETVRNSLEQMLRQTLKEATTATKLCHRKTITTEDVIFGLRDMGASSFGVN